MTWIETISDDELTDLLPQFVQVSFLFGLPILLTGPPPPSFLLVGNLLKDSPCVFIKSTSVVWKC